MSLSLLTPWGLLLALGAVPPIVALVASERRARRLRRALRLENPSSRRSIPAAVALVSIPCLLALAVAQPVVRVNETHRVRSDAEAFYIFDVSRSMLASAGPGERTRFDRAVAAAERLHTSLSELRSGVATLTDRVLPNVFPTADEEVFAATVERALAVNSPPPRGYETVGTLFAALDTLANRTFFTPGVSRRVAIVLTDGESAAFDAGALRESLERGPSIGFVIVRFWNADERIWNGEQPEHGYRASATSGDQVRRLASATGGTSVEEGNLRAAVTAVRERVGTGPLVDEGTALRVHALSGWLVVAALVPLALLLWRRNVL